MITYRSGPFRVLAYSLVVVVMFTSLVDFFVNRLLFRAGPEVLSHMNFDASGLAAFGRISFTFEQLALFVILGVAAILLLGSRESLARSVGFLVVPQLVCGALLYLELPVGLQWGASTLLVFATWGEILGLVWLRAFRQARGVSGANSRNPWQMAFLISLGISFSLPIYFRASILLGVVDGSSLPLALDAYSAGIFAVMATSFLSFAYAIAITWEGARKTAWTLLKASIIPTLAVGPFLYGILSSFFMGQIFSLVVAMSTDITPTYTELRLLVLFWWFLLTAFFLLLFNGRRTRNPFLVQSAVGLILVMSTSFLFNYPTYLLLGTVGVLLLTFPLRGTVVAAATES